MERFGVIDHSWLTRGRCSRLLRAAALILFIDGSRDEPHFQWTTGLPGLVKHFSVCFHLK